MNGSKDRTGWIVFGCVGGFFVVAAVVVVVFVLVLRRASTFSGAGGPPPPPAGPRVQPWLPCTGVPAPEQKLEEALAVADPSRADVADVFAQARALALRLEPSAQLATISSPTLAAEGTYDLASGLLNVNFEYRCLDSGKPPGQDRRQGQAYVLLRGGKVLAQRVAVAAGLLDLYPPLHEPPCSSAALFRAVVASGVPKEARATFLYTPGSGVQGGAAWLVAVPGHPELSREVDGVTCRRVTQHGRPLPP